MSANSSTFQDQLETIYEQHRRQGLESELDELAETMEETILERVLAEAFFRTEVEIDSEAKHAVEEARSLLEQDDYDALAERLPETREAVEAQRREVNNFVHQARIDVHNTVRGMIRLNQRVERVDQDKLDELDTLLDNWNWEVKIEGDRINQRKEEAREYGSFMRQSLEETKDALFGPYRDTPLDELVDRLLDDERLTLAALSEEELNRLYESDLADYLEVTLS
jgi:CRISPR/Cas system CMR-associated protein Cmr5 small subunit